MNENRLHLDETPEDTSRLNYRAECWHDGCGCAIVTHDMLAATGWLEKHLASRHMLVFVGDRDRPFTVQIADPKTTRIVNIAEVRAFDAVRAPKPAWRLTEADRRLLNTLRIEG